MAGATPIAPRLVWHGQRADRVVALTFDDGWSPERLRRIFRILEREQVPATFFVTGVFVNNDPALWRQIAAAGYPLANHTYFHHDTRTLTDHLVEVELARTQQVVERATGRPMAPLFRPPYGSRSEATDQLAATAGFPYIVMWDVTGGDTAAAPTVAEVVRAASAGRPGSIVLLHAGPQVTPNALPAIIAAYRARGFGFVTVPQMLGLPPDARATGPGSAAPGPSPAAPDPSAGIPTGDDASVPPDAGTPPGAAAGELPATPPADGAVPSPGTPPGAAAGEGVAPAPRPAVPGAPPAGVGGGAGPGPGLSGQPAARDAAWARSEATPVALAVLTAAGLVVLVLLAAVVGRRRSREDSPPAP